MGPHRYRYRHDANTWGGLLNFKTSIQTYTHTDVPTERYVYICTHTYICIKYKYKYKCKYKYRCKYKYKYKYTNKYKYRYKYSYIYVYKYSYIYMYMYINVNVNVHTLHTYIHAPHTYILWQWLQRYGIYLFFCAFFFANVRAKNNAKFNLLKIFNQSVSSAYFFGGTLNMQILIKMRHANIAKM